MYIETMKLFKDFFKEITPNPYELILLVLQTLKKY